MKGIKYLIIVLCLVILSMESCLYLGLEENEIVCAVDSWSMQGANDSCLSNEYYQFVSGYQVLINYSYWDCDSSLFSMEYYVNDKLIQRHYYLKTDSIPSSISKYYYNDNGRLICSKKEYPEDGSIAYRLYKYFYNENGKVRKKYIYNSSGNIDGTIKFEYLDNDKKIAYEKQKGMIGYEHYYNFRPDEITDSIKAIRIFYDEKGKIIEYVENQFKKFKYYYEKENLIKKETIIHYKEHYEVEECVKFYYNKNDLLIKRELYRSEKLVELIKHPGLPAYLFIRDQDYCPF